MRMKVVKRLGRAVPPEQVRVTLCDRNPSLIGAFARHFDGVDGVEVLEGSLLDLDHDAIVSPANSFGDMGGGIDQQIDNFYDGAAQSAVIAAIAERFYGELPVGVALVVEMPGRRLPFLVSAPTMRVPGCVAGTINAYLAMRAALVAILHHNGTAARRIGSVGVPGLGTGVGGMDPDDAALQMRACYDAIIGGDWRRVVHPVMAPFVLR
jgi:O-acetyl-ADP-ribose deacetylase (regulator of RNase III)